MVLPLCYKDETRQLRPEGSEEPGPGDEGSGDPSRTWEAGDILDTLSSAALPRPQLRETVNRTVKQFKTCVNSLQAVRFCASEW